MNGDSERTTSSAEPAHRPHLRLDKGVSLSPKDPTAETQTVSHDLRLIKSCLVVLSVLAVFHTLYFARAILLPMAMAIVLGLVLKPVRRRLTSLGLPDTVSAIVVFGVFTLIVFAGIRGLWEPANHWLTQAPESLHKVISGRVNSSLDSTKR